MKESSTEAEADTFPTGGYMTSLQAFALGAPVVTLPGQFLGGRLTLAMYEQMGLVEPAPSSPSTGATSSAAAASAGGAGRGGKGGSDGLDARKNKKGKKNGPGAAAAALPFPLVRCWATPTGTPIAHATMDMQTIAGVRDLC